MGYFAPTGPLSASTRAPGSSAAVSLAAIISLRRIGSSDWPETFPGPISTGNTTDPFAFAGGDPFFAGKAGVPATLKDKVEWLATTTGRIGYAWERWMLYGKGGIAWEHSRGSIQNLTGWGTPGSLCFAGAAFAACNPSGTDTSAGWTVGVGLTWAFASNWSAGIEYDHYGFGSHSVALTASNVPAILSSPFAPITGNQRIDAVKFTLDYHFSWLGRY